MNSSRTSSVITLISAFGISLTISSPLANFSVQPFSPLISRCSLRFLFSLKFIIASVFSPLLSTAESASSSRLSACSFFSCASPRSSSALSFFALASSSSALTCCCLSSRSFFRLSVSRLLKIIKKNRIIIITSSREVKSRIICRFFIFHCFPFWCSGFLREYQFFQSPILSLSEKPNSAP